MEVASIFSGQHRTRECNEQQPFESRARRFAISVAIVIVLAQGINLHAQVPGRQQVPVSQNQSSPIQQSESGLASQRDANSELQTGTALTRKGLFREAIPHLQAARGRSADEYAVNFNLALCYLGTSQFKSAIDLLNRLRSAGHDRADVENLLAQAYVGNAQPRQALASLQRAAALSPQDEKLFSFVAEAFRDHEDYGLGLKVVDIGLQNLPRSARLHYERAMFLTQLDQFDEAKPEFALVGKLAPASEISALAAAHKELLEGDIPSAIRDAREGVRQGYENPALLTVLGQALIRSGIIPGQPEFAEAQTALEKAVAQRPNDPASQIALGGLYLAAGRLPDAIAHLETARQLEPANQSVYANLAKAFQRHGDLQQAQEALATLQKLNQAQADRISSAPGDRKMGYAGHGIADEQASPAHQ
ncbi:MAG: tetratricopeptide repeat protein [Candidatus Sulfotelmatobacter sp.]